MGCSAVFPHVLYVAGLEVRGLVQGGRWEGERGRNELWYKNWVKDGSGRDGEGECRDGGCEAGAGGGRMDGWGTWKGVVEVRERGEVP